MHRARLLAVALAIASIALPAARGASASEEMVFAARDTGFRAGEPTLGVLPDGSIVYQAYLDVIRSTDEGISWTSVHKLPLFGTTLDPFIHVDTVTGRIYSSQLEVQIGPAGGACQTISISDDLGKRWLEDAQCGTFDHQGIGTGPWPQATSSPLYERLAVTCSNRYADSACSTSLDGGLTWGAPVTVFPAYDPDADTGWNVTGYCGGIAGKPEVGPDGTIYLPKNHCSRPFVGISRDGGVTWTVRQVSAQRMPFLGSDPDLTIGDDGTLFMAWTGTDWRHHVARSADFGQTWTSLGVASPPEIGSTALPVIVAGRRGAVATAYVGTAGTDAGPDLAPRTTRWSLYVSTSFDADADVPTWTTVRATPESDPLMIGCVGRQGDQCSNVSLLDFNGIALTKDGRVLVSYTDACDLALCRTAEQSTRRDGYLAVQLTGPRLR